MTLKITILGCGNSTGIPAIGNYWGKCDPAEPKNKRARSSILVQSETTTLIIDTGPDFKHQLNRIGVKTIDAALYTHAHSDHADGLPELRVIKHLSESGNNVPVYMEQAAYDDLGRRFNYLFKGGDNLDIYPPILEPHIYKASDYGQPMRIGDIDFTPFLQDHGTCETVGYRFGDLAYSVDILNLDDTAIQTLKGVKTWVVDCAGYHSDTNPVHANLKTIYALNYKIKAELVFLTSLTLAMDYQTMLGELKTGYAPAFDGLKIMVNTA